MDSTTVSGTVGLGSIPSGCTAKIHSMKPERLLVILMPLTLVLLVGCSKHSESTDNGKLQQTEEQDQRNVKQTGEILTARPLQSSGSPASGKFIALPPEFSGLDLNYSINLSSPNKHLYVSGFACGGVAAGDLDGDNRPDLFFAGTDQKNRFYRNLGDFRFEDATMKSNLGGKGNWASAATLIDIENDGDLDVYITNYDSPNTLYLNNGKGIFTENAAEFGLDLVDASLAPAFCDYDRDGDLDLYLLTNRYYSATGFPSTEPEELSPKQQKYFRFITNPLGERTLNIVPRSDRLLRNDNGKFIDVSKESGITRNPHHGLAATWWDYDKDGWPDLYVSNDFDDPDALYHNEKDGTFVDVTAKILPHTAWFSMGADSTDIDGDGWPDLLAADMSGTTHYKDKTTMGAMGTRLWVTTTDPRQYMRNALYLGTGTGRMMEAAYLTGIADSDWTWAVKFADFDGDGRDDLFLSNGMTRNFNNSDLPFSKKLFIGRSEWIPYENTPPRKEQNLAFHNVGELNLRDVSKAWGLAHVGISYAAATADFDLDGDPDLVVVNMDEPVTLYRNDLDGGKRVSVRLVGTRSNRSGFGARLEAQINERTQQRWLRPLSGFKSGDEPLAHFGLKEARQIDRLTIHWPSGVRQELRKLKADTLYTIMESGDPIEKPPQKPDPLFKKTPSLKRAVHGEQEFNDFQFQPLLPNKLSFLGPGSAWGDVDGDGDDDFFLGGGCGYMGQLHINEGNSFRKIKNWTASITDRGAEDMAPLFFDADGDGDLDLFVASGGVEAPPGHQIHSDRLYMNNGSGYFNRTPASIPGPPVSSGPACAADFDRDGDLDLFVGGRVIPGQYPMAPGSRLLINDGKGIFIDKTSILAPTLKGAGMVTGAIWSDADNNGWLDLLLTREWGSVALYLNFEGKLEDRTIEAGLAERTGWWNGITGMDADGDGDMDYAVTNFGLNTKYHASAEHPILLYYGEFDSSRKKRLVEAEFEGTICYPIRGRSCSTRAIPSLAKKFDTYRSFAVSELKDIYSPQLLNRAIQLETRALQSGLLVNDGKAGFKFIPFPRLAQIAPGFGIVSGEFNGDGNPDLVIAQNFFSPQPETGRMDGGISLLMTGMGNGKFNAIRSAQSGISVSGDAMSATLSDTNGDSLPDLHIGINSDRVRSFKSTATGILSVRLPVMPGTKLTLNSNPIQSSELYLGSGYLSQSAPVLFFAIPRKNTTLTVHWPDGQITEQKVQEGTKNLTLNR
jgi:enediyne biosynthesis protein E4